MVNFSPWLLWWCSVWTSNCVMSHIKMSHTTLCHKTTMSDCNNQIYDDLTLILIILITHCGFLLTVSWCHIVKMSHTTLCHKTTMSNCDIQLYDNPHIAKMSFTAFCHIAKMSFTAFCHIAKMSFTAFCHIAKMWECAAVLSCISLLYGRVCGINVRLHGGRQLLDKHNS